MTVTFSPEFRLALDCCRRNFVQMVDACVVISADVDWPRFLRLVHFHRVEGLAWNALSTVEMPHEMRKALSETASTIAAQSLQASAECRSLSERFERAGVSLLFLKGATLGVLAYGNPALKSAIDVDLLIDPNHLLRAAALLRSGGYELIAPRQSLKDQLLEAWHVDWKESVWAKTSPSLQIDLHTRTADNSRLTPSIGVHSSSQSIEIGSGIRLATLADEELFAYLAVHGASSAWFRLKWISDFAGFLCRRSADEIEQLYRGSQQLGAGRAAGQALLLADALFGTLEKASDLKGELRSDRATYWLYRAAFRLVTGEPSEPTETRGGTFSIHWTQLLLLPGFGYKLSEVKRQAGRLRSAGN